MIAAHKRLCSGFTLVELSIVLVIIGLLISGILVARSMIGTSKTQAQIHQISQYDVSIQNFRDNYRMLPGDGNIYNTIGNNDGLIDGLQFDDTTEVGHVWHDLYKAKTLSDGNTYILRNSGPILFSSTAAHMPKAKSGTEGTGILVVQSLSGQGRLAALDGFFLLAKFDQLGYQQLNIGGTSAAYAYTGAEAMAIDEKIDDGVGYTGNMVIYNNAPGGNDAIYYPKEKGLHYILMIKYNANTR